MSVSDSESAATRRVLFRLPSWRALVRECLEERVFLGLLAATIVTRLGFLAGNDIWIDEWDTVQQRKLIVGASPLFYPHYLAFQIHRFSLSLLNNVWGLRLPSAVAGILSVLAIYLLARMWFRRPRSLAIATLTFLSPFLFYMGLEARFYTMYFLWITISLYFASIFILRHSIPSGILAMLSGFAAYLSQPASIGMVVGEIVWIFVVTLWDWRYWFGKITAHSRLFRVLLLAAAGLVVWQGVKASQDWIPTVIGWQNRPLSPGVSFSWEFFRGHFDNLITSPASSKHFTAICRIGQTLMALGFLSLWIRRPALNILLCLQYIFFFASLFLTRAGAPYTWKYAVGLLVSQHIWIGSGMFLTTRIVSLGSPEKYRPHVFRIVLSGLLLLFALLYLPDYGRIALRSINPVSKALDYIASASADKRPVVFSFGFPAIQILNLQHFGFGSEHAKNLDLVSVAIADAKELARVRDLMVQMRNAAYWTGSSWMVGCGVKDDQIPDINEKAADLLELDGVYPSCLWPSFWSFLYRVPIIPHLVLYPYPKMYLARVADGCATLTLDCLVDGTWRLDVRGEGYRIKKTDVDGVRADRRKLLLAKGRHALALQFVPEAGKKNPDGRVKIQLDNALRWSNYTLPYFRLPLKDVASIIYTEADGTPAARLPSGSMLEMPLARMYEEPRESLLGLRASSEGGPSFIACLVDDYLEGIVPIQPLEKKSQYFRGTLPPRGETMRLVNITPVPAQLAQTERPPTETLCRLYTFSTDDPNGAGSPDANLLASSSWPATKSGRFPFFRLTERGLSLAWMRIGKITPICATGRRPDISAIEIPLAERSGSCRVVSPPFSFGTANSVFLRTWCRNTNPAGYGYTFRVNYFAKPTGHGADDSSWSDAIYFDKRRPGETGFFIELLTWVSGSDSEERKTGRLFVEELVCDPHWVLR